MKISFREQHLFQLLKQFETQHLPLDLFLSHYFRANRALGSKDRQCLAQAVYGMCRHKSLLDYLIKTSPTWEKRYALFLNLEKEVHYSDTSIPAHTRVSFPEELFSLLVQDYGENTALELCQISNTEAPITVRINPLKTTRAALLKKWQSCYDVVGCEKAPFGMQFKKRAPLVALDEFKEGLFEIQDEASQLVAALIKVQKGEQVLDYCCGSGGKTLGFAHLMENKGQIYLHDIRPHILMQAKKRLKRAGIQNGQFLTPNHPFLTKLKKKMDWTLVDVPCSGTGTLRRNPDQKWKFSNSLLDRLVGEQRKIFEKALSYVRPMGKIVYATCSILAKENEEQIEHFLKTYPLELDFEPFKTLPTYGGMDGFFAAVFNKN